MNKNLYLVLLPACAVLFGYVLTKYDKPLGRLLSVLLFLVLAVLTVVGAHRTEPPGLLSSIGTLITAAFVILASLLFVIGACGRGGWWAGSGVVGTLILVWLPWAS